MIRPYKQFALLAGITVSILLLTEACSRDSLKETITPENYRFVEYPGFPNSHSTWGDIGYNSHFNSVYIGVTNHADSVGLFEYDIRNDRMSLNGFIGKMANLRDFQWQGKIHSKILTGPDNHVYFATDGGESREEYLMEHPHGYAGGYVMKWDPETKTLKNLGNLLQYESIKDIEIDHETGIIYAITYPQVHFILYNPVENQIKDLGRLGSSHVPRVMFTDKWGNCYYVDWRQRLVKYDKQAGKLLFDKNPLPAFPGTPGSKIITGITAYAKDIERNIIYLITYGAKILAFYPQESGIGVVEDLGGVLPDELTNNPWGPYCPNLAFGNNGKLYYIVGGHGNFSKDHKTLFMEFDPETKTHVKLFSFDPAVIAEITGSDVIDKDGNIYFAARKEIPRSSALSVGEGGGKGTISKPFMLIFNPEKKIGK
jgi:hypothetical protein